MFTLAHEIAHLWLGQSGVSNTQAISRPDHSSERWCNRVAAELLVPSDSLREELDRSAELGAGPANPSLTSRLARRFKVSTLVVLRRSHDTGELDWDRFRSAYLEESDRLRQRRAGSGGDYYLNVGARASKRFARALIVSSLEGRTPFAESLRLLDIKKVSALRKIARGLGVEFGLSLGRHFIQAKNLHYGFDLCPAFWDWLIRQNLSGQLYMRGSVTNCWRGQMSWPIGCWHGATVYPLGRDLSPRAWHCEHLGDRSEL